MSSEKNLEYLGDGVYAEIDSGFQILLKANCPDNPSGIIYLEPAVMENLIRGFQRRTDQVGQELADSRWLLFYEQNNTAPRARRMMVWT